MDGHPRQNPAYRPATSKPRIRGASTLRERTARPAYTHRFRRQTLIGGGEGDRHNAAAHSAGSPPDRELIAATFQHYSRSDGVDYAEVDIELHALRNRSQVPEHVLAAVSLFVRCNRLRNRSFAESQPVRSGAVVVNDRVGRPLEVVTVIRDQLAYPDL